MDIGSSGTELLLGIEECELYKLNGSTVANDTIICLEHAPQFTRGNLVRAVVLSILAVLSLIGNSATIYSIKRSQRARRFSRTSCSAIYNLILHLSIADLLVTVFCLAGEAAWNYTVAWEAGNAACKMFKFSQMFSLYLSTFVLVLIGVDRYVAVRYPMKNLSTGSRGTISLIIVWTLSAVFSIPQIFVFHEAKGPFVEEFYQCVTHGVYTADWQEPLYTTLSLLFMFVIPLIILIVTYTATFITIAKSEKVFKEEVVGRRPDLNRRRLIHRAKMKSLRISAVIVAAFIIWWTPYYTMMIIFIFLKPEKHVSEDLQSSIFFFGMSNSLVNPIIYGAFQLWSGTARKRRGSQSRDFTSSTRMTQASVVRSSTRLSERINVRTRRDREGVPDAASLVLLDRNRIPRINGPNNGATNTHVVSKSDHLGVSNGSAITRV